MGLDIVAYVLAVEDLFEVRLPDAELRHAGTPRDLAGVIQRALPHDRPTRPGCLSQRAFYQLRKALLEIHPDLKRQELKPSTECHSLNISTDQPIRWRAVGEKLNIRLKDGVSAPGRVSRWLGLKAEKLGELTDQVVAERPWTLRKPDEGWTDGQIVEILLRVVEREQGLESRRYNGDSEFIRDMRMD